MSWEVFSEYALEYDSWYERFPAVFQSELILLKELIPQGFGVEVGIGTGRFASALGITLGVDPALKALELARRRGVSVVCARAEKLPFKERTFDFVLMNTLLCFLEEPVKAFKEAHRVLKKKGALVVGFIDGESFLGRLYRERAPKSKFFSHARFWSVHQVLDMLESAGFRVEKVMQTIFVYPDELSSCQTPKDGFGEGGFVVVRAFL